MIATTHYKALLKLGIPIVIGQLGMIVLGFADTLMIGHHSTEDLAAASFVNNMFNLVIIFATGFSYGLTPIVGRLFGSGDKKSVGCTLKNALWANGLMGILLSALMGILYLNIHRLGQPEELLPLMRPYYIVLLVSLIFVMLFNAFKQFADGITDTKTPMWLLIGGNALNILGNWILIYGHLGAPELGVAGAAIGTLTARIVECVVLIIYIARKEKVLNIRPKDYLKSDRILFRDYAKLTAPMALIQGLWGLNTAMQTVILGHMTSAAIAANSVASTLFLLVKSIPVGAASTASILIGKKIGEGDMNVVKNYARALQKLFVMLGLVSGILLFFIRIPVLNLYDLSESTREMANSFLLILCVIAVTMSYQMPTNIGIIRGGGSATFVMKVDLISIWGIVIPLSFFMAFVVKASPIVVVCCLNADQVFKCIPAFIKVNYGNWIKKLTR